MSEMVPVQSLIDHIKTAVDVDPWAKEMAEELLKEHEAVEARKKNDGKPQPWTCWWYVCGDCGQEIEYHDRFCRWCGRSVKWK
jgi:hypothetical protein